MAGCDRCGDDRSLNYSCNYCSGSFCTSHRLPENHHCPGLRSANTHGPDFRSDTSDSGFLRGVFGGGSSSRSPDQPGYDPSKEPHASEPEWDSSPDVAPDGSIVRNSETERKGTESGDDIGLGWMVVGFLLLPFIFLYNVAWSLLSLLFGILTRPVPLILFLGSVALAAHLFGVIDIPFGTVASGVGAMVNATGNGTADASRADHQQGYNTTRVEIEFVALLNEERGSRGLSPVRRWDTLTEIGDSQAENMAEHDYIGHKQPDTGLTIKDRYDQRGLLPQCELPAGGNRYYPGAENAAGGVVDGRVTYPGASKTYYISDEQDLAQYLFDSWMDSSGHRRVMVLRSAERVGLGLAITDSEDVYAALEFC